VHTFITVWWSRGRTSLLVPSIAITSIWIFVFLLTSISLSKYKDPSNLYYAPTPVRILLFSEAKTTL
jgi:hypothetical protein